MIDLTALDSAPRLLLEAHLRPTQSDRFQPTGFPDLGPAAYTLHDGTEMLLVESAQSMANRCEQACWDENAQAWVSKLNGLPFVHVDIFEDDDRVASTATVLEAHRLNSPYVLDGLLDGKEFKSLLIEECDLKASRPVNRPAFLRTVLKYDPASLLHGLFMSNAGDGRLRLPRALSSFIEARNVRRADSGGVKNDRVNPSGSAKDGFGNVPFPRTEFTAQTITAFFNLDLHQVRGFGFPTEVTRLLLLLALYKIARLLGGSLRLRTACSFDAEKIDITAPAAFKLPSVSDLEADLAASIAACKSHFANPAVTRLRFVQTSLSAKESKKTAREKAKKS